MNKIFPFFCSAFLATALLADPASTLTEDSDGPLLSCCAPGGGHAPARPDDHAPIGVMGDHVHAAGEWMLSYRFMFMRMDDNYVGTDEVADTAVLIPGGGAFTVAPTVMTMEMHMFGLMYAPTDCLTLMAMVNYTEMSMDHRTAMGGRFETNANGFGDTPVSALYRLWKHQGTSLTQEVIAGLGVSLPTGSTDVGDVTPMGFAVLPYPMQLGSGTFDLLPSLLYKWQLPQWSGGAQARGTVHLDENDEGYTLGDRFELSAWAARNMTRAVSLSARLRYENWADIDGADPRIATTNPMMMNAPLVPTAFPELRGGERLSLSLGVNVLIPSGGLAGNRIAVEVGMPLWQDLDGPQLGTDYTATVGWQLAF